MGRLCDQWWPGGEMLESAVERALVKGARARAAWAVKMTPAGHAGFPDRIILAPDGRVAFVELKRPGGRVRPLQEATIRRLRALGFRVEVLDRPGQVRAFLNEWLG